MYRSNSAYICNCAYPFFRPDEFQCHVNFFPIKHHPVLSGISSKFFDHLLLIKVLLLACVRFATYHFAALFQTIQIFYGRRMEKGSHVLSHLLKILVHGQVTIIFVVSVCLFVYLFVCAEFFSAVFDPISIKLGHMLYVWV